MGAKMNKNLLLKPIISEKAYGLAETGNTYVFKVPKTANKHSVAHAVTAQFDVSVTDVRIANIAGKAKRVYRKRSRGIDAKRADVYKAYVTLKEGDKLPFFAEPEGKKPKESKKESK